jgi:hypothetical protein
MPQRCLRLPKAAVPRACPPIVYPLHIYFNSVCKYTDNKWNEQENGGEICSNSANYEAKLSRKRQFMTKKFWHLSDFLPSLQNN